MVLYGEWSLHISSGLIEKVLKYSGQYIYGGTFENVVLQGGWSYKEWSYSETGLYLRMHIMKGMQIHGNGLARLATFKGQRIF